MSESAIEFADLVMKNTYGRGLDERQKEILRNITKDTYIFYPRHNGKRYMERAIMAGVYYDSEALTEEKCNLQG